MVDANKTQITRDVTAAASVWLTGCGFKPIESEVICDDKWIADLASFCFPSRTEAQKLKIIRKKPPYGGENWKIRNEEWEADYLNLPAPITTIVEVKTTMQDFKRDDKFAHKSPVNLLYIAYPASLIDPSEIDIRWGILSHTKGGCIVCLRRPELQLTQSHETIGVIAQIAIRRHHFTAYERSREFQRQARNEDNDRISRLRVSKAVRMVVKINQGEMTADEAVRMYLKTAKLPQWEIDALRELENQHRG